MGLVWDGVGWRGLGLGWVRWGGVGSVVVGVVGNGVVASACLSVGVNQWKCVSVGRAGWVWTGLSLCLGLALGLSLRYILERVSLWLCVGCLGQGFWVCQSIGREGAPPGHSAPAAQPSPAPVSPEGTARAPADEKFHPLAGGPSAIPSLAPLSLAPPHPALTAPGCDRPCTCCLWPQEGPGRILREGAVDVI